jgi:hypothetical protein
MESIIKFSLKSFTTCGDETRGLRDKCFSYKYTQECTIQERGG